MVAGFDKSFLAAGGVASSVGGVDGVLVAVVDEGADEGLWDEVGDDAVGYGRAVVEVVAVASDVYDDFGGDGAGAIGE